MSEYLNTSYHPDMEYVDGTLVERSVPTLFESLLQAILGVYFRQLERLHRFKVLPKVRIEIIKASKYRIPDLLLCATPMPPGRIMDVTPLAVIEILSPTDTMSETLERLRDYAAIGVPVIIQMDPEKCIAHRFEKGSLIETEFKELEMGGRILPFDSETLFEQFRSEHKEATEDALS